MSVLKLKGSRFRHLGAPEIDIIKLQDVIQQWEIGVAKGNWPLIAWTQNSVIRTHLISKEPFTPPAGRVCEL